MTLSHPMKKEITMCKFCEAMERWQKVDAFVKERDPDFEHRYSVALVVRNFRKGRKGPKGSTTDYRYRGCGYQLNYCPECGREMKKRRRTP